MEAACSGLHRVILVILGCREVSSGEFPRTHDKFWKGAAVEAATDDELGPCHVLALGLNPAQSVKVGTSGREAIGFFAKASELGKVVS